MDLRLLQPLIVPLVTISLGIILLPFIEKVKNRIDRKRLLKALIEELSDEKEYIDVNISIFYSKYMEILDFKEIKKKNNHINSAIPSKRIIYSIEKLLNNHFENLPSEVRQTLKFLNINNELFELCRKNIQELYEEFSLECDIIKLQDISLKLTNYQRSHLKSLLANSYFIQYLLNYYSKVNNADYKPYPKIEMNNAIKIQLKNLDKIAWETKIIKEIS